jgi:tRNA pseudouridine55 synthase
MFGFFNIDKPTGITSHDAVARVRRIVRTKKVGHAGTLDPLASGVLIVAVGGATRLTDYVMHQTKRYRADMTLGITTTTYDAEGEIVTQTAADHISRADIERVLPHFTGEIEQIPPMYSAIKQGGHKLYDLARAGIQVERAPRRITIQACSVIAFAPPRVTLDVRCSAGTYIRSLAYDIGQALGVGAYLSGLVRTESGGFSLTNAVTLDTLEASSDPLAYMIAPSVALADYASVTLDANAQVDIAHGRTIPAHDSPDGITALGYTLDGRLMAVLESSGGRWKPGKVFPLSDD